VPQRLLQSIERARISYLAESLRGGPANLRAVIVEPFNERTDRPGIFDKG